MPKFIIKREIAGVGKLTDAELRTLSQEDRPAVGQLEPTRFAGQRPGESLLLVTVSTPIEK